MPVRGIFVENSHAFNTTDAVTTNEQWLNVFFASPPEQRYLVQDLFDADDYGHCVLLVDEVPEGRRDDARSGVENCPEQALSLEQ